ncbi:ethylmalonyl-CoA decarboxylase isoform X3 [Antennarius striatus]|uniref:ethylmalonyl-CoA decarboxylase isoform X3 n=1 Tax=Antennarius striatus TaxID=241820 RepID=UPI0035B21E66
MYLFPPFCKNTNMSARLCSHVCGRMVLFVVGRQLWSCGAWARLLLRQNRACVHSSVHDFNQEEIREKLQGFLGGSIDLLQQESGIAVLTINNPSLMNALSGSMMVDLEEKVTQLERWTEGKGLVVVGAAGTFCSGSDLNAVRAIPNPQDGMKMCMFMHNTLTRLHRLPLISVALVEGRALGGGAELTTACDFRLVASSSVIQFVHKHMGLIPGWGGAARLMGLVDGVLQVEDGGRTPLQAAEEWLSRYTKGAAPVIQAVKKVVLSGRELPLSEALRTEKDVFGTLWGGPANLQALAARSKHK